MIETTANQSLKRNIKPRSQCLQTENILGGGGGGGGLDLLALSAIFPSSVISSFFTQNKVGGGGGGLPLDPPLDPVLV